MDFLKMVQPKFNAFLLCATLVPTALSAEKEVCCEPSKVSVYGDFLWWRADLDDAELAVREEVLPPGNIIEKELIEIDGKWEPGFRVGLGYRFGGCDCTDLGAMYTRFHGKSDRVSKVAENIDTNLLRQGWVVFLGPIVSSAKGSWNIGLDVVDFFAGHEFRMGECFSFRPYGGVRIAWVDLDYRASYIGVWENEALEVVFQDTSMRLSSDFFAGGLRGGFQFLWEFCNCVGIFGDFSFSALYGCFDVKETFSGGDVASTGFLELLTENYKSDFNGVRANIDALLGLKSWMNFCDCCYTVSLFAGYELSHWFSVNELFREIRAIEPPGNAVFTSYHLSSDIGFQGLTVRASFAF